MYDGDLGMEGTKGPLKPPHHVHIDLGSGRESAGT